MLTRTPTSEWKGAFGSSCGPTSAINGAVDSGKSFTESIDDSSVPSAVSTDVENNLDSVVNSANSEGLGIGGFGSPLFAETKTSSDDCAANTGETPSSVRVRGASVDGKSAQSAGPSTPTPKHTLNGGAVPTYKIALSSSLLERATKSPRSPSVKGV